ncbi:MAG: hypothetical protein HXY34_02660 [Candidatus Thorarchaeota archaeon]|nr:hypothetical protein [Candidatus Thorarchaeota archaeon]
MSSEMNFKTLILYLSAMALVLFFLIYMPYTYMSPLVDDWGALHLWIYYFTLVLGVLFPLFYGIGEEDTAWYCLGLAIILNSVVWMLTTSPLSNAMMSALMTLIVGVLFFITPFLMKKKEAQKDMIKSLMHILKGLFIILATAFYANWVLDDFIGTISYNHVMPQFIYIGGGLMVVFGFILLVYGALNILKTMMSGKAGELFGKLSKVFYILMVIVFLLGITFNVMVHPGSTTGIPPWQSATYATSIGFFADVGALTAGSLVAFLLLVLYIYGMNKIVEKQ